MTARPTNIIRRHHSRHFTVITNEVLDDARLALDELGFLGWLLSRPHDWEVIPAACRKRFKIGRDKFYRIMAALVRTGYASREKVRAEDGTIVCVRYIITDDPGPEQVIDDGECDAEEPEASDTPAPVTSLQRTPKPDTAKPDTGLADARLSNDYIQNNPPTPQVPIEEAEPSFKRLLEKWPSDHILSQTSAERRWLRLPDDAKRAALAGATAYRADMTRRGWKLCDLTTYLRDKRFERFASGASLSEAFAVKGGTPEAYRWLEYRRATIGATGFMEECFRVGKPWYAPSQWPPALPPRATGPPSDPDAMSELDAELAKG